MTCAICRHGELKNGLAAVTLTRESLTLVVKDVPASICDNCGEEYVNDDVSSRLLTIAEEAANAGVQVDVRNYLAA